MLGEILRFLIEIIFTLFGAILLARAWLFAVRHWETPQPRAMPAATSATATAVFLKTVLVMWFSLQSAIRLFRLEKRTSR